MNSVTQGLFAAGCRVRVLAMSSAKHPVLASRMGDDYRSQTTFEAVPIDLAIHPLDAAVSLLCGDSYHVKRFESKAFAQRLAQVLKEEEFDIVHLESLYLTPYVPLIRKHSRAPVVLRSHNVEHLIWRRMAASEKNLFKRWYLKKLALALRVYEVEHLNDYDGILSITPEDGAAFRQLGCRKPVVPVPFGVPQAAVAPQEPEPATLYHLGSMDWLPNQEGVRWFLDEVWPLVRRRLPTARLFLAGRRMPEEFLGRAIPGVTVVGEVDDVQEFICSKQISIVPLLSGSGIRVKIIEAMAAGKVVVSTRIGAAGIAYTEGEDLLVADSPEEFAAAIARCVEDPEYSRGVGRNAARLVAEQYGADALSRKIVDFYNKLAGEAL